MSVGDDLDYRETIGLLEEEINRLEGELRARDEEAQAARGRAAGHGRETAGEATERLRSAGLAAELAARDETIALLMEQCRILDEAAAADRENWEQLNQWVQQLEERVEGQGDQAPLAAALDAERREAEAGREAVAAERRAWEARHRELEGEADRLRAALSRSARDGGSADVTALAALEHENRRLREAVGHLARVTAAAAEADSLRDRLQAAQAEAAEVAQRLRQSMDDRQREHNESQAAIAELRSQLVHRSLHRDDEAARDAAGPDASPTPDERIRALRIHLQQIHEAEQQKRAERKLTARLSRLWNHTSPRH